MYVQIFNDAPDNCLADYGFARLIRLRIIAAAVIEQVSLIEEPSMKKFD